MHRFSGDFAKVSSQLAAYKSKHALPDFIELHIKAPTFSHSLISDVESLISDYSDREDFYILKHSFEFEENSKQVTDFFDTNIKIEEMKPIDIFNAKVSAEEGLEDEKKNKLTELFKELLVDIQQND